MTKEKRTEIINWMYELLTDGSAEIDVITSAEKMFNITPLQAEELCDVALEAFEVLE